VIASWSRSADATGGETVDDTRYEIVLNDTVALPVIYQTTSEARYLERRCRARMDAVAGGLRSLLGRNVIASPLGSDLPRSRSLALSTHAIGELGLGVRPARKIALAAAIATDGTGGAEAEVDARSGPRVSAEVSTSMTMPRRS